MRILFALFTALTFIPLASAADPTYWQDVRPILRKHCTVCHNDRKKDDVEVSAGLSLSTLEAIKKGGKVPVLKDKNPTGSLLISLLHEKNAKRRMPLDADPLPADAIATLTRWVVLGSPEGTKPAEAEVAEAPSKPRTAPRLKVTLPAKAIVAKKPAAEPVLAIGPLSPVTAVALNPGGTSLAVGSYGRVVIWDLKTVAPRLVLTNVLAAVNDVKYSPDGKTLAVSGGQPSVRGDLRLFAADTGKLIRILGGYGDVVASIDFSPDGKRLVTGSFDRSVRVWNLETGELQHLFSGHSDTIYAVAFSPKGDWYATASKDRTVRVVDTKTGQSRLTFSGMDQEVLAVAIRPDGEQVVSSGFESQLFYWQADTGMRIRRQGGHDIAVYELTYNKTGTVLASAGADKTVRLWNGMTGTAQRTIPTGSVVYAVTLDDSGKRVLSGNADGLVRLYDGGTGKHLLTLWAEDLQHWIAITPDGTYASSEKLPLIWQVGGKPVTADEAYNSLRDSKSLPGLFRAK